MEKTFFRSEDGDVRFGNLTLLVIGSIFALLVAWGSWVVIGAEEVGVPVTLGEVGSEPSYGFTGKLPFVTRYVRFEKTTQRMSLEDQTYTKDLQPAKVKYTFTYKIVPERACELYRSAGVGYENKLIDPALDDALKGIFGKWTATELVANRNKVANQIEDRLKEELPKGFFCEISIKLDDISYSDAFEKGIEQKVLAEQEAQKSKNQTVRIEEEGRQKVIQAKAQADAAIAAAEGKAKAMDIEGAAIRRNSQYLELKKLDVQQKMAESAGHWTTVIMSGNQANTLLNVPSGK
ncbi:MAG: prohibitin family protein [Alphaproteobacteria bacterium]|nr:prohibitin family protein [Alphaproteobacteria bacterium]